jgi:hypothetical protein
MLIKLDFILQDIYHVKKFKYFVTFIKNLNPLSVASANLNALNVICAWLINFVKSIPNYFCFSKYISEIFYWFLATAHGLKIITYYYTLYSYHYKLSVFIMFSMLVNMLQVFYKV